MTEWDASQVNPIVVDGNKAANGTLLSAKSAAEATFIIRTLPQFFLEIHSTPPTADS